MRGRGGVVANVTYDGLTMQGVGTAISVTMFYGDAPPTNKTGTPTFRNIYMRNITAQDTPPGSFDCLPESPCTGFVMDNVHLASDAVQRQQTRMSGDVEARNSGRSSEVQRVERVRGRRSGASSSSPSRRTSGTGSATAVGDHWQFECQNVYGTFADDSPEPCFKKPASYVAI